MRHGLLTPYLRALHALRALPGTPRTAAMARATEPRHATTPPRDRGYWTILTVATGAYSSFFAAAFHTSARSQKFSFAKFSAGFLPH
jgi:hypothetical protein